jgi:putative spermidine/putrescine transport system permease protein
MFLAVFGTITALLLGVPAAYALSRYKVPFGESIKTIVAAPIIVPGIIVGLALLRYLVIPLSFSITVALFSPIPHWYCPMRFALFHPA